jgi:VIT1/CCC1 family predicted Fe2+/Mn2+ transporter
MATPLEPAATPPQGSFTRLKHSFLGRLLDPLDSFVEAIYTVLIILTFTLAVRVAEANLPDGIVSGLVEQLFWACLGCAVAWGLIDGVMYILSSLAGRGQDLRLARVVRGAADEAGAVATLAEQLDDRLAPLADEDERHRLYAGLYRRLESTPLPAEAGFEREDLAGALGIFLVALSAALPVCLPLLLLSDHPALAVRASNAVAILLLFVMGYRWARYAGGKPVRAGLFLVLIGLAMVIVAIPLGG